MSYLAFKEDVCRLF